MDFTANDWTALGTVMLAGPTMGAGAYKVMERRKAKRERIEKELRDDERVQGQILEALVGKDADQWNERRPGLIEQMRALQEGHTLVVGAVNQLRAHFENHKQHPPGELPGAVELEELPIGEDEVVGAEPDQ